MIRSRLVALRAAIRRTRRLHRQRVGRAQFRSLLGPALTRLEERCLLAAAYSTLSRDQARDYYLDSFQPLGEVAPSWTGSVVNGVAGQLGPDYQAAILARFNAFRYMAGLPDNVTLDTTYNDRAQAAALMMSANRALSHDPPPTWTYYTDAGHTGAASSDLFVGTSGTSAIDGYMSEGAPAGHRRWILYPPQSHIGIGDVPTPDGDYPESNATYILGTFGTRPTVPFVAWPPAAYLPWQLIPNAWSFALDGPADFSNATVSVLKDGVDQTVTIKSRGGGFGDPALEWTVSAASRTRTTADVTYEVTIHGVKVNGELHDYSYQTTVFDPTPTWFQFAKDFDFAGENAGSMALEVDRMGDTSTMVSVSYASVNGTATAGSDYTATQGTLNFAVGETSKTITVPLIDDGLDAVYWEGFKVILSHPSRGTEIGTPSQASRLIGDSDGIHAWMNFKVTAVQVNESAGSVALEVTRGGIATDADISINYATVDGTAKAGTDYESTSGTLDFGPGVLSRTITVPIVNDLTNEGSETFRVVLADPTNGAHLGEYDTNATTAVVTIADDDPATPTLGFRTGSVHVGENAGSVKVEVLRTGLVATSAVDVDYATADDSAIAGIDYTATAGTLHFAAGQDSQTIEVPILDDAKFEPAKSFRLTLDNPAGGAVLGAITTAIVTIDDDDPELATVAMDSGSVSVAESAGAVVINVVRSGNVASAVSVSYATSAGSAAAGADYTSTTGTLRFAAGQTLATIRVPIINDPSRELAETFTVKLSAPGANARLGPATTRVTINDDDPRPPRLIGVRGVRAKGGLTQVVLDFSSALDPASATKLAAYTLRGAGRDARFGTKDDVILAFARAGYDVRAHRATLTLARALQPHQQLQLIAQATILRGPKGQALDGDNNGFPGGNAVRVLTT